MVDQLRPASFALKAFDVTLAAGGQTTIAAQGTMIRCLEADRAFTIQVDSGAELPFDKGLAYHAVADPVTGEQGAFRSIRFIAPSANPVTFQVVIGQGGVIDDRVLFVAGASALTVVQQDTVTVTQQDPVPRKKLDQGGFTEHAIAAATETQILAAASKFRHVAIKNIGTLNALVSVSGTAAGKGWLLLPGETLEGPFACALDAENPDPTNGPVLLAVLDVAEAA